MLTQEQTRQYLQRNLICDEVQSDGICQYRFDRDRFFGWVLLLLPLARMAYRTASLFISCFWTERSVFMDCPPVRSLII